MGGKHKNKFNTPPGRFKLKEVDIPGLVSEAIKKTFQTLIRVSVT